MWVLAFGEAVPGGPKLPVYNGDRADRAEAALDAAAQRGEIVLGYVYREVTGTRTLARWLRRDYAYLQAPAVAVAAPPSKRLKEPALAK